MTICSRCNTDKPIEEFTVRAARINAYCKSCQAEYGREWHVKNKININKKIQERNRRVAAECRKIIWEYLSEHPCVDCGESNPIVLEFDHIDPLLKSGDVGKFKYSPAKLVAEIVKCEIRCANCHRKRTARQLGWWSDMPL